MLIKIIRTQNNPIGHAILYAWSEDKSNDYYLDGNNPITKIKLDYNRKDASNIIFPYDSQYDDNTVIFNPPTEADLNITHTVTLHSNTSFNLFCSKLIEQGYDTNLGYHLLKNSCVDAIRFALNIAKIKIEFNNLPFYKRAMRYCFWKDILTSYDLLVALQESIPNERFSHPGLF